MVRTFTTSVDCSKSVEVPNVQEKRPQKSNSKMSLKNVLPGTETKSGYLMLVMGQRRQRLQVKIYGKTLEPFVAFYPDKKHCTHCGVMKLRGCRVEAISESDTDFRVIPKCSDDGKMLVFGADTPADKEDWLEAFSAHSAEKDIHGRTRSRSLRQFRNRMPSLAEMDEETCSDSSDFEHEDEESSHITPTHVPRSRHNFLQNLDKYGRRSRCCSHPVSHDNNNIGRDFLTN